MHHLGVRRGGQPLIYRSAFVGFHMAEADPAQFRQGHHPFQRGRHQREHGARAAVKQQRLTGIDQELVEVKPRGGAISATNVESR